MTERQLQSHVVSLARALGFITYHTHDSRRSEAGFPDLVMARGGGVMFRELKTERGRVSADQAAWLEALPGAAIWRPSDLLGGRVEAELRSGA